MYAPPVPVHIQGYLHGFTPEEAARLRRQARILEHRIHRSLPFHRAQHLLEVGCGVGAQTETLLRHFPQLFVTGVDASEPNLAEARRFLEAQSWADGRWELVLGDGARLRLPAGTYDAAYLCWILEHVADPERVLSEVRRVLRRGSPVAVTEVMNASFFLNPYSPATLAYWTAYNDRQLELGGDPFVGAKLGNLLLGLGYRDIATEVSSVFLDNRAPEERAEFLEFWTDMLLSGAPGLLESGRVSDEVVAGMKEELAEVAHDPDAVFLYSFVQARAVVD